MARNHNPGNRVKLFFQLNQINEKVARLHYPGQSLVPDLQLAQKPGLKKYRIKEKELKLFLIARIS